MIFQNAVWAIALAGIGLIALGFILVISQARKSADDAAHERSRRIAGRLRAGLFLALLVVFVAGSWATLHRFPIPPQHDELAADQVVEVTGQMWAWQIEPKTIEAGSPVEFRVTATDVNHGFAVYAPDGRIVTQTQAMPGYTNRILHTFRDPGSYRVMCLEYCGLAHRGMVAEIEVVEPGGE